MAPFALKFTLRGEKERKKRGGQARPIGIDVGVAPEIPLLFSPSFCAYFAPICAYSEFCQVEEAQRHAEKERKRQSTPLRATRHCFVLCESCLARWLGAWQTDAQRHTYAYVYACVYSQVTRIMNEHTLLLLDFVFSGSKTMLSVKRT